MDVPHLVYPIIMVGSVGELANLSLKMKPAQKSAHYFYTFQVFKNFRKFAHFGIFPNI